MNRTILIRNARLLDPLACRDEVADIGLADGLFADPVALRGKPDLDFDARGLVALPGLLDIHVHFREPGDPQAETVASGSRAAARGGFATVAVMPNTQPPLDTPARIRDQIELGRQAGLVRILPVGCLTCGRKGEEPADLDGMAAAGAVAFSDDGATVANRDLMRHVMRQAAMLKRPVMDHALDPERAGAGVLHAGETARRLGLPGIPSEAETVIVERDIALCRETGCATHVQHVSAAASVALIRDARRQGLPVSGEATPHHLLLCDEDIPNDNADFKMNPPLRARADRDALLAGVADGTLQAFATDHAPHTAEAKRQGLLRAPFGAIGLETAAAVTYTACVVSGRMNLADWARRWTVGPADVLGLPPPSLAAGQPANLTLFDPNVSFVAGLDLFASRSRNSPFLGRRLTGRVAATFFRGVRTWSKINGAKGQGYSCLRFLRIS